MQIIQSTLANLNKNEFIGKLWVAQRNMKMLENSSQKIHKNQGYLGKWIHEQEHNSGHDTHFKLLVLQMGKPRSRKIISFP